MDLRGTPWRGLLQVVLGKTRQCQRMSRHLSMGEETRSIVVGWGGVVGKNPTNGQLQEFADSFTVRPRAKGSPTGLYRGPKANPSPCFRTEKEVPRPVRK